MFGWKPKGDRARMDISERSGAMNGTTGFSGQGLIAGTRVASNLGWRPVEALMVGDKVLTFDNGMQTIVDVRRTKLWRNATRVPEHQLPVLIPENTLGNRVPIRVLPDQGVMVESDAANDAYGDPFAVVVASGLVGFREIRRDDVAQEIEIVTLYFSASQIIYAEGGLLVYCPQSHLALTDMIEAASSGYEVLDEVETAFLVECMEIEDSQSQLPRTASISTAYAA